VDAGTSLQGTFGDLCRPKNIRGGRARFPQRAVSVANPPNFPGRLFPNQAHSGLAVRGVGGKPGTRIPGGHFFLALRIGFTTVAMLARLGA
jgi:hypothetical protein